MNKPWDEPLPPGELDRFAQLENVEVVFDVGARTSLEYLSVKPDARYHLFEPWPPFFEWLQETTKDLPNVFVNGYGLGDEEGELRYDPSVQSFMNNEGGFLPIKTLDWYVKENNISKIDFLKIDAERWDYKVLQGGKEAIKLCRYIQFETWKDEENKIMFDLLESDFILEDIGFRNIFCTRK